jgi:hypothetical protein
MKYTDKTALLSLTALVTLAGCGDALTAMHGGGGAPAQPASTQQTTPAPNQQQRFSVDTTLGELARKPDARAVVQRFLPSVMEGPHAAMAAGYTPRQIQAQMPNMLTQAQLTQMDSELAAIQ